MHSNPAFRAETAEANLAAALARGFGALCVNGAAGPLVSHLPFCANAGGIEFHVVRNAPMARALATPQPGVMVVSGADAYVSPDWYGMDHQVPTWNYHAVHLRGRVELLPESALLGHLERLSATFEDQLQKAPWKIDKMPDEELARKMRAIVPVVLHLDDVQGTLKLGQNKPAAARIAAGKAMLTEGFGPGAAEIGARMVVPD
ncbi:FMN-binding negative transcriptional regulator [Phaeovulum sp.]|uniref:FMN-binding negative transcriptional regulator n=1 Tax=Phaeovulum sp. TaxID=2934796 RepID=UPI003563CA1B